MRVPGFQWKHAEHIAGIETLCLAFAQQEHSVHIWNVIWICAPNVLIGNILFTAKMRPCHVSEMYPLYYQWAHLGHIPEYIPDVNRMFLLGKC